MDTTIALLNGTIADPYGLPFPQNGGLKYTHMSNVTFFAKLLLPLF